MTRIFNILSRLTAVVAAIMTVVAGVDAHGRTVQHGIVKEYNENSRKTPLSDVQLMIRKAQSTVSDGNGRFDLEFPVAKPGEKVNVRRIMKPGYEIFNIEAVEQWNINPEDPFIIIMCKSDRLRKIRDNYQRVASESYARQYDAEQTRLARERREGKLREIEYEEKLSALQEEYESQLDRIDSYVDRFSRIDLSELTDTERRIIDLVSQGRLDEAISRYEELNFVGKYAVETRDIAAIDSARNALGSLRAEKETSRKALREGIDRQINALRLAGGRDNSRRVLDIYAELFAANPADGEIACKYARELNANGSHSRAIDVLDSAAALINAPADLYNVWQIKGVAFNRSGLNDDALKCHERSQIYASMIPDSIESSIALKGALLNKAATYSFIGDFDKASATIDSALSMPFDSLSMPDVENRIKLLNTLGQMLYHKNDTDGAMKYYTQAEQLFKLLPEDDSNKEKLYYIGAVILENQGNVLSKAAEHTQAINKLKMARSMLQTLYDLKNPVKYRINLATVDHNLALSMYNNNDFARSRRYIDSAINRYREALMENPSNHDVIERLMESFGLLTNIILSTDNNDAIPAVISRIDSIGAALPFQSTVFNALTDRYKGALYRQVKDYAKATEANIRAAEGFESLVDDKHRKYVKNLAQTYSAAALNLSHLTDSTLVTDYLEKADLLYDELLSNGLLTAHERFDSYNTALLSTINVSRDKAIYYLKKMQEMMPTNGRLVEMEAIILDSLGREDEAREAYGRLISINPDYDPTNPLSKKYGK